MGTLRCQTSLWARDASVFIDSTPKFLLRAVKFSEGTLSVQSKTEAEMSKSEFKGVEIFQSLNKGKIQEGIMKNKRHEPTP